MATRRNTMSGTMASILNAVRPNANGHGNSKKHGGMKDTSTPSGFDQPSTRATEPTKKVSNGQTDYSKEKESTNGRLTNGGNGAVNAQSTTAPSFLEVAATKIVKQISNTGAALNLNHNPNPEVTNAVPQAGPNTSLHGKVAIVTGSARSTGAAVALALGSLGATVVVNYVHPSSSTVADSVVQSIRSLGRGGAIAVRADASTIEGGKNLVEESMKVLGVRRVDILVLCAGVMESLSLDELDEASFERAWSVNVKAPLFLVKRVAETMPAGGRVIFFSSSLTAASTVTPNSLAYLATKGAIEQISRVLAKDLGARGITVNTVSPGAIDTPQFRGEGRSGQPPPPGFKSMFTSKEGKSQTVIDGIARQAPARRLGETEDLAPVVGFLVSPAAGWVNGQNLRVDGGFVV